MGCVQIVLKMIWHCHHRCWHYKR